MRSIDEALRRAKTLTFDCYGTLIDWRAGIESSLRHVFGGSIAHRMHELFGAYVETEAQVEAEGYRSYRDILSLTVLKLAERFEVRIAPKRADMAADLLPQWKPFFDTNEALTRLKKRYRLGILSNIDRDLLDGTVKHFDVPFDFVITAQDVRSYKPAPGHFEHLLEHHAKREEVLHVAQSVFHDGTAAARHGLAYVWINRYNDVNETSARPLAEYPDLKSLADAVDAVTPGR